MFSSEIFIDKHWKRVRCKITSNFQVCLPSAREQERAYKISLQFWMTLTKRETTEPHITHLMFSYSYCLQFLCSWWQFIANKSLSFLLVFTSLLCFIFVALQKLCQENFGKFQGSWKSRFGGSEKDRYFLRFQNGSINLLRITNKKSWFFIF